MNSFIRNQANAIYDSVYGVFGDDEAKITGKRRDSGSSVSRDIEMRCRVIVGEPSEALSDQGAPLNEMVYQIEVKRDNWLDATPPQPGDIFEIVGYQEMRAQSIVPAFYGWTVNCITKGGIV